MVKIIRFTALVLILSPFALAEDDRLLRGVLECTKTDCKVIVSKGTLSQKTIDLQVSASRLGGLLEFNGYPVKVSGVRKSEFKFLALGVEFNRDITPRMPAAEGEME